jgi:uncharacterized protein (DUF1330 family)
MKAYVIFDEDVFDPEGLREYIQQAPAVLTRYGGKLLTAGGTVQSLEGDWRPALIAMLEFESMEQARRWYPSEEYTALIPLRRKASNSRVILVEATERIEQPPTTG